MYMKKSEFYLAVNCNRNPRTRTISADLYSGELHDRSDATRHLVNISSSRRHEGQLRSLVQIQLKSSQQFSGGFSSSGNRVPVQLCHLVLPAQFYYGGGDCPPQEVASLEGQ